MQKYNTDANVSIAAKSRASVILVTGASGFIGSRLVAKLLSLSPTLRILSNGLLNIGYFMESEKNHQRQFILYCSLAGFISAWAISGLLVIVDVISGTPAGTFFAVIGISLGFSDPVEAQYIGFLLHVITGVTAGNIFGQLSLFWLKIAPYSSKEG
jgi:hypothetical protein